MDDSTLVPRVDENAHPHTDLTTSETRSNTTSLRQTETTPFTTQAPPGGMSLVWEGFTGKGVSDRTKEILMGSWTTGTKSQYAVYLQKWEIFCRGRNENPFKPPISLVLDFLTELFDGGRGYSAINTARSALSTIVTLPGDYSVGTHPLVRRFMRGVFQVKPTKPRYDETWDTSIVLNYLESLDPVADLTLKDLTQKLVMLTLLVTGQRGQTIHLMDLDHMKQGPQTYSFLICERIKTSGPRRKQPELVLSTFKENDKLCVIKTLKEYIKRTKDLRNNSKLFITCIKPHKEASRDTISGRKM